ncbi:recombinase family protein [Halocatena salina]|uniref:Recombinase family protein n=1 Tax=Halocatena salina TaxID=2934340 RepID=A0A8U0A1W3_9EURY|nr:recombinase family protein [Halocatena salina]UPM43161.1 recombinase family protein [Halocatena salina]
MSEPRWRAAHSSEAQEQSDVAIYARTSSRNQRFGYSLNEQVRVCIEHCEMLGWTVAFIYKDEAESGKDTDRPMFQKLLRAAKQRHFDVIMFWKLDRFSRSLMHAVQLETEVRTHGVGLYSVTEQIDTTSAAGRFNFRNIASAAEFERDMIQQRTQMGLRALALDHKWPNDQPPLGYAKRADGTLRLEKSEAELVREIFDLYLQERSMPAVAELLNGRETTTKAGNRWCARAVGDVLRNSIYIGEYEVGDIVETVPEYRIVDDDVFQRVTAVRHRFRREKEKRTSMPASRKERIVNEMLDTYDEYLQSYRC